MSTIPRPHDALDGVRPGARSLADVRWPLGSGQALNDLWSYDLGGTQTWTQLFPGGTQPLLGYDMKAVYDPVRDRLVVVSGDGLVWALPLSGGGFNWSQIVVGGTAPTIFLGFTAVYDPAGDRILTFGGRADCPPHFEDCVRADGHAALFPVLRLPWDRSSPRLPHEHLANADTGGRALTGARTTAGCGLAAQSHAGVRGQLYGHAIYYNDVGSLGRASATWTQLQTTGGSVAQRAMESAIYDPIGDRLVVNGGRDSLMTDADTWELHLDTTPPAAVSDLSAVGGCTLIQLTWTAPGDDGTTGTATQYDLRRSSSQITDANFAAATSVASFAPTGPAGTPETFYDTVGQCSSRWYYALKTLDNAGNWSAISNSTYAQTACPRPPRQCLDDFFRAGPVTQAPTRLELRTADNPVRDHLTVSLHVPTSLAEQSFELSVFDLNGRDMAHVIRGHPTAGTI
jgi:hypothetical protein